MLRQFSILFSLFSLFFSFSLQAATIYVTPSGAGDLSGSSWENALPGVQLKAKLDAAVSGDEIWVAAGTYKPTTGSGDAARLASFVLKAGVSAYGGFAGGETTREQRNWTLNVTTLSGEIGVAGNADNSLHVVTAAGDMQNAVFDGFTVTGGNANAILPSGEITGFLPSIKSWVFTRR